LVLKDELESILASTKADAQPVQLDQPIGRLTRIDAIQQQKMLEAHRRRSEIRLQQVNAALGAYGAHSYGICRGCKDPISWERLKARPEAPICLECQEELES
jgi:DnaK suppressor protein